MLLFFLIDADTMRRTSSCNTTLVSQGEACCLYSSDMEILLAVGEIIAAGEIRIKLLQSLQIFVTKISLH